MMTAEEHVHNTAPLATAVITNRVLSSHARLFYKISHLTSYWTVNSQVHYFLLEGGTWRSPFLPVPTQDLTRLV